MEQVRQERARGEVRKKIKGEKIKGGYRQVDVLKYQLLFASKCVHVHVQY